MQHIACVLCTHIHTQDIFTRRHAVYASVARCIYSARPTHSPARYMCCEVYNILRGIWPASPPHTPQATAQATAQAIYCGQFINRTVHKLRNTSRDIMSGFYDFYGGALPNTEFYGSVRAKITRPSTLYTRPRAL